MRLRRNQLLCLQLYLFRHLGFVDRVLAEERIERLGFVRRLVEPGLKRLRLGPLTLLSTLGALLRARSFRRSEPSAVGKKGV